jgi:uncharacterized protein (DUF58 family)
VLSRLSITLIVLLLLASLPLRQGLLFVVALALLLAAGVAWLWGRACLDNVEYRRRFSQRRVFFGEEIDLTIEVVNRKALPLAWLAVEDEVPATLAPATGWLSPSYRRNRLLLNNLLSLRWYERVRRHYRLRCDVRGEHFFGPAKLRSGDIFGFATKELALPREDSILVYPKVVPITRLGLPARDPFGDRATRQWLFEDPLRTVGVRDYLPGDSPRRMHWAATARRGAPQVKVYEPTTTYQLVVVLNTQTHTNAWWWPDYLPDRLELAVTVAASVAAWGVEQGYQTGIFANANLRLSDQRLKIAPSRDPEQLPHILTALARLQPVPSLPLDRLLRLERRALPYGATLVVVTAALVAESLAEMLALRAAGYHVALLLVGDVEPPAGPVGVPVYPIGGEETWRDLRAIAVGAVGAAP